MLCQYFSGHHLVQCRQLSTRNALFFGLLLFAVNVAAVEPEQPVDLRFSDAQPYLGLYTEFSRWDNGVVPVAYNHNGAPSGVSQFIVEKNLQIAFGILENLADLHFDYRGVTSSRVSDTWDNVVVIGWEYSGDSFAGRASALSSLAYVDKLRLGYYPFIDGSVTFNSRYNEIPSVQLITHEVMHMLGLGHSDSPASIMHPYSYLYDFPQTDDIAGLQAMYGPPDIPRISNQTYRFPGCWRTNRAVISICKHQE